MKYAPFARPDRAVFAIPPETPPAARVLPTPLLYPASNNSGTKATFDGTSVLTGRDGRVLYDQSGYGRPKERISGSHRRRPCTCSTGRRSRSRGIPSTRCLPNMPTRGISCGASLCTAISASAGTVVQTGPHDYPGLQARRETVGTGESLYLVRVLSEA